MTLYQIEDAWYCWHCAENIGFSFVNKKRKSKPNECCENKPPKELITKLKIEGSCLGS